MVNKMELNREKIVRELDSFHHRVLNSKLAERMTERDIMAIINAAALIIEDGKRIEELTKTLNRLEVDYNELYEFMESERLQK